MLVYVRPFFEHHPESIKYKHIVVVMFCAGLISNFVKFCISFNFLFE